MKTKLSEDYGTHTKWHDPEHRPITKENAEQLARTFHTLYEKLAPDFGYETRKETREFDPTTPNGRLMIAVCDAILKYHLP